MTFIATLLTLAAIGAATLIVGPSLLIINLVSWLWRKYRGAEKVRQELRDLETGTCDGLTAEQIVRVVEECWLPSAHC